MNKETTTPGSDNKKSSSPIEYVYECISCKRIFHKKTMDPTLEPHKDKNGNQCFGMGAFVKTETKL